MNGFLMKMNVSLYHLKNGFQLVQNGIIIIVIGIIKDILFLKWYPIQLSMINFPKL